jgi:hypothetical protein
MTTKIMNAIKKELNEKNLETIMKLKTFLDDKIDGDTEQLMSFIDEFIDDLNVKTKSKDKKKRGPSYYNYWLGIRISELKKEEDEGEREATSNKDRMKAAGADWKNFKESDEHDIQKKEWERKTTESSQDESSNDDEKSVKSSSNEDDVDEIVSVKKSNNKKKPKPKPKPKPMSKPKKTKKSSKKSQDVSDDSEDNNISNSSSDDNDKNVLSIIDADTESDEE